MNECTHTRATTLFAIYLLRFEIESHEWAGAGAGAGSAHSLCIVSIERIYFISNERETFGSHSIFRLSNLICF